MSTANLLRAGLLAGALVMAAACGGAPAQPGQTPASPAATPASPGQPAETPAEPGQPAETPGQPAETPGQPGAGNDLQDPCGLVTVDQISQLLGVEVSVAEENIGGTTTYCNYVGPDQQLVLATSYSIGGASRSIYGTWAMQDDSIELPGIGDGAVWTGDTLYVLSGESLVGVTPSRAALEDVDDAQLVAMMTTLAQLLAGRI